nr:MAG TPA: hypothetical protein [Caudoviricetes sp.]
MLIFSLKQGKIHNLEERIDREYHYLGRINLPQCSECCLKASRSLLDSIHSTRVGYPTIY